MVMNLSKKISSAYREGGSKLVGKRTIRKLFLEIRPLIPSKGFVSYNGVRVKKRKFLERHLGFDNRDVKNFEEKNIRGLEKYASEDDRIIVIGGGFGVTSAKAHDIVKEGKGSVKSIEASKSQVEQLKKIKKWNNLDFEIEHGIVGEENDVYGKKGNPKKIDFEDLDADLIQVDIEGAECQLLESMVYKPSKLIVETHGSKGCGSEEVKEKLKNQNYSITDLGPERDEKHFIENDVRIIVGELEE